jgi:glyoxylase-like metal-dependent hydrolase (beta-lactamase superfamily II)
MIDFWARISLDNLIKTTVQAKLDTDPTQTDNRNIHIMSSQEIQPGLHQIWFDTPTLPGLVPVNVFLLIGDTSTALINSGFDEEDHIEAILGHIKNTGIHRLDFIILAHCHHDHIAGTIAVKKVLGGAIICPSVEKQFIKTESKGIKVDRVVEDGDALDLGGLTLEFVHTSGHTLGSLSVFVPDRGAFFPDDNVFGKGTTTILHDQGDMGLYINSLHKIMAYSLIVLYSSHAPIIHQPGKKLAGLIHRRLEPEREILALLHDGGNIMDQIFLHLYPIFVTHLHDTARLQIPNHISRLKKEKRVVILECAYQVC